MQKSFYAAIIGLLIFTNLLIYSCNQESADSTAKIAVDSTALKADTTQQEIDSTKITQVDSTANEEALLAEKQPKAEKEVVKSKPAPTKPKVEAKKETRKPKVEKKTAKQPATYTTPPPAVKPAPPKPKPAPVRRGQIKYKHKSHDFGTIIMGEKVQHLFSFANTGKAPLVIEDATATCGCTIPEIPLAPIPPGGSGTIKVIFDSKGKIGVQTKPITVTTNGYPRTSKIYMKGVVITENLAVPKKEEKPAPPPPKPAETKPTTTDKAPAKPAEPKKEDKKDKKEEEKPKEKTDTPKEDAPEGKE